MNQVKIDTIAHTGKKFSVILLAIEETQGSKIFHYYYEDSPHRAVIRNPEILSGGLIRGAVINIILFQTNEPADLDQEVILVLNKEDLLPKDLAGLLGSHSPRYKTPFGFITSPRNNKGRYYSILKNGEGRLRVGTGYYQIDGRQGKCLDSDGEWEIRHGLVENHFYNQPWPASPVKHWVHDSVNLAETLEHLTLKDLTSGFRNYILDRDYFEYFYSDDWSPEFYRTQAKLGFIAITAPLNNKVHLLPQLQTAFAVLDWKNLTPDKATRKILDSRRMGEENIRLRIDPNPALVLENLQSAWKKSSWLEPPYVDLIKKLSSRKERKKDKGFRIWGVTLEAGEDPTAVAGELGYTLGNTYTSLSGFFRRDLKQYNNFGKLQMVLLARVLEKKGIAFWNLGHPYMDYKIALGAKIVSRQEFLTRWDQAAVGASPDLARRQKNPVFPTFFSTRGQMIQNTL